MRKLNALLTSLGCKAEKVIFLMNYLVVSSSE